ncbi:MAG TPA: TerC family protein [Cyclobacteriaceae bacterium]|nr:TerC family protein [Cyclobacteriaceae bacterium]
MEFSTEILISLVTLTFLEVVLGIDNIVFISIVGSRLPAEQQKKVRIIGLTLALAGRILLLLAIGWIIGLTNPIFTIQEFAFSFRDLILIVGGLFLIAKSTSEMHKKLVVSPEEEKASLQKYTLRSAIVQIILLDLVFSLDSIITAVGLVDQVYIIVIAIVISMTVMLIFSKAISDFINNHPTMKLLAVAFLLMIGTVLVIEGLHVHVPKGYIYFSMAFALGIELLNMRIRKKTKAVKK